MRENRNYRMTQFLESDDGTYHLKYIHNPTIANYIASVSTMEILLGSKNSTNLNELFPIRSTPKFESISQVLYCKQTLYLSAVVENKLYDS